MVDLDDDIFGNPTRIENKLSRISDEAEAAKVELKELEIKLESAKEQLGKPFEHEAELTELKMRMNELTAELDIDDCNMIIDDMPEAESVIQRGIMMRGTDEMTAALE